MSGNGCYNPEVAPYVKLASGKTAVDVNYPLPTTDANVPKDIRYDASDYLPTYIGLNITMGAATSASTWTIFKYTYSGNYVTRIQRRDGVVWDDRATLF